MKERNVELIRMAIADEYGMSEVESRILAEVSAKSLERTIEVLKEMRIEFGKTKNGGLTEI